jgi:hypothetical protein
MNWCETIKTTKNYFAEVLENAFNTRNAKKRSLKIYLLDNKQ